MSNTPQQIPDDQLSPREVIDKVLEIKNALVKNWIALLFLPLIGFGIGYALDGYLKTPVMYEAEVVFNLGGGSQGSGLGEMAGLLGLGSAPDANIFTGENFFYFVTSRPVMERNLMKEVTVNGKKEILANFFIDSSGIKQKEWEDRADLQKFHFTQNNVDSLPIQSRMILNELVAKAVKSTEIGPLERKSSFTQLSTTMENATLAGLWVTTLLTTVESMYTESQTQKTRKTLKLLEHRADSLARVLGKSEHSLAKELDYSSQLIVSDAKVTANSLTRKSNFLQQLYYEAMGNAEKMRVSLVREAPLFTEIEGIKVPLDSVKEDKKRAKIGVLAGLLVAFVFIYLRTILTPAPKVVATV